MYQPGQSGNPEGRPKGTKNKRTLLREALDQAYDSGEAGFWLALAEKAREGDTTAIGMVAARLIPPLKANDEPIILDGLEDGSLTEKAERILGHMGNGCLSPSEATSMIGAISQLSRVQEVDELADRMDALEAAIKEKKR